MDTAELAKRLGATPLFSPLTRQALANLIGQAVHQHWAAGTTLAHGPDHHIVLLGGRLRVERHWTNPDGQPQHTTREVTADTAGPGFALISALANGLQVQAETDAHGVLIASEALDEQLAWPDAGGRLALTRRLKVFQQLQPEQVQLAVERMTEISVPAGQTLVKQGESGESYYFLLEGEAEVWVTDPQTDKTARVAVLGEGDGFGEEALLTEGRRTATVTMLSPGRLLRLAKTDFDSLLKPQMVHVIEPHTAHYALSRGQATLIDCRLETEYQESRIPGARLVPLSNLRREGAFALDPDTTYIVYCRSGRRSSAAAFLLRERGIRALSLRGGLQDWPFELDNTPL